MWQFKVIFIDIFHDEQNDNTRNLLLYEKNSLLNTILYIS
jgi:hypothetical protein